MPHQCHVAHRIPGRIRLKAPAAKGDRAFFQQVSGLAKSVDGVRRVEANPLTGSLVIHYDRNEAEVEQRLEQAFQDQNTLLSLVVPEMHEVSQIEEFIESDAAILAKHSRLASGLVGIVKALNLQLKRATNNAVDLKVLFPLAFAGGSLLLVDRRRDPFLWIMLLLVSFHTFLTLHQAPPVVVQK